MKSHVFPTKTLNHYVKVIVFMKKYDCGPTTKTFCSEILFLLCREKLYPSQAFGLGAIADNDELCIATLAYTRSTSGVEVMARKLTRGTWKLVNPRYLYALAVVKDCTFHDLGLSTTSLPNLEDRFRILLEKWDKCKSGNEGVFGL